MNSACLRHPGHVSRLRPGCTVQYEISVKPTLINFLRLAHLYFAGRMAYPYCILLPLCNGASFRSHLANQHKTDSP